jgi:hypothetical protein
LEEFNDLKQQSESIGKQLKGFISYLNASDHKGTKNKVGEELSDYRPQSEI